MRHELPLMVGTVAAESGTPVALPTLPALHKGAHLLPDEENCRIVYEWGYYCRKQGMSK
jgi:hypothetical protein